jgi:hypothetical protein
MTQQRPTVPALPNGVQVLGLPRVDGLIARLITSSDDPQELTLTRTTDTRTALARGLVEYLGLLSFVAEGGREMSFANVQVTWAEPEQPASSPALTITGMDPGSYADTDFTPTVAKVFGGQKALLEFGALEQEFLVTVWSTDPMQRMGLATLIEDASDPVDWMSGFRLELPFYFGARATYTVRNVQYLEGAQDSQRRWRLAVFGVRGVVPKYRPIGAPPLLIPEVALEVGQDVKVGKD